MLEPDWIEAARSGKFELLPEGMDWNSSTYLAQLINGYEVSLALGWDELSTLATGMNEVERQTGRWDGSAMQLWLCLFYEHRRYRHSGYPPEGDNLARLERLCSALVGALHAADANERATIVSHMDRR